MPEPNIQYSVEFPDGKRANISKEVYESTKDNLYSKYPEAKVVRTSVYQPDDDDIADSDQYAISFGGNRAVISNQAFQETKDSLLAQYPDAQITKMRDESAAYWEPRRQAAMAKLDELDKQNGDFMRQYNANKTVADLLENDGVVASGQHDFVAANKAQYDTLDRQRRELLEQYYSNPNTIREYREGASRAGSLHDAYMANADVAETGAERRDWKRAAKLQDDIRKVYEAPNKYTDGDAANGFLQYLSDYAKGAGDVFSDKDFYTRGFTEIARNFDLRGIAKKIEEASNAKGGDLSESDIDRIISPSEKAELMSFYALSEAQRERADSISSAYRAGSSFADSVGYMAEFLLSSGLGNLAGKAMSGSSRALTSWLGKQLMSDHALRRAIQKGVTTAPQYGSKAAKVLTEAAVKPLVQGIWHTGTQISSLANISEGLLETNSNGELVSVGHAILKRGVDSVIENWSESVGGALEAGLAAPFKAAGWLGEKTLGGTSFARAARWLYESGPAQVLFEAGFNGMLGEIAEEWVGNATRVAFGLMSKDEFKDFASFRQQAEMAASFAPMSLIGLGSSTMAAYRKSNQFKAVSGKVKGILQKQGVPDGEIEDLFNTKFDTAEDIGRKVAPYLYNAHQANNADDYKTILQFIELAGREAVFEEFDKVEKEQERNSMQEQIAAGAGQFWYDTPDNGSQVRVVETDGKTYYILGEGVDGTYAAISSDGERKVFSADRLAAGAQDGTLTDTQMSLDDYLQQRVDASKKTAEAERMNREANEQLAAVKAQIAAKPEVNLGTREAPVLAAVTASDNTGVMVAWNDEEGNYQEQPLTWNEVANKLQTPIVVRTDEQLENDAAAALDDARARVAQYQKITPGTEIRVDLPELGEATYRFQKAIVDEGQVIIYAEDENGESKQFTEEMVVDLPGLLAQEDAATAVNVPEEGTNVVFTDENGDPVKGVVSVKDNGSGFTSVVTPAGDTVVIETARVEQDAAPAQEPEDDGVLRDFRGNPIPMIESGEDAGEVDLDAFFDRDTEAWARWNDEQRGDGGADSRQNIEVALKAVQKTIKAAQKEHDATASPNKRRKQEQAIATLVQRAEQLQGLIDGYVAREEAAKAEEEARRAAAESEAAAAEQVEEAPAGVEGGLPLTEAEAESLLSIMEEQAEDAPSLELTPDNWILEFGESGEIQTPIGTVKMGENQLGKLLLKKRQDEFGMIRPTLENPDIILEESSEASEGQDAERPSSYLFIKTFNRDGKKIKFYASISVKKDGLEVIISNHFVERKALSKKMQGDRLLYTREALLSNSSDRHLAEQRNAVPDLLPTQESNASSENKDSNNSENASVPEQGMPEFNDNPEVAAAEAQVDLNPTDAQKEAGNYQKGHVVIDGHDITIENPKGSVRSGVDADGNPWSVTMNNTYGYIRRTEGVDGDQIDVFLSDNPTEGNVYVVDQVKPDGSFDEHKVMYGFASAEEAQAAYLANYSPGWKGLGVITEVSKEEFAKWLDSSTRKTKPFSEYKSVEASGAQNQAQQPMKINEVETITPQGIIDLYNSKDETSEDKGKPGRKEILNALYEANPQLVQFRNEADQQNAVSDVIALARQFPDLAISKRILGSVKTAWVVAEQQEIAPAEEAVAAPAPADETAPAQPEAAPAAEAESAELTEAQKQVMEFAGVESPQTAEQQPQVNPEVNQEEKTAEQKQSEGQNTLSWDQRRLEIISLAEQIDAKEKEIDELWKKWLNSRDENANMDERSALRDEQRKLENQLRKIVSSLSAEELDSISTIENKTLREIVSDTVAKTAVMRYTSRIAAAIQRRRNPSGGKAKPVGKVNLFKYTSKDDMRPAMTGVFHDKGFAVASDASILVADKASYDKKKEGKVVDKDGKPIKDVKYPQWRQLFNDDATKEAFNFAELRDFLASVRAEMEAEYASEKERNPQYKETKTDFINNTMINLCLGENTVISFRLGKLEKFADFAEHIGAHQLEYTDERRAVAARSDKGVVMLMPVLTDFTNNKRFDTFEEKVEGLADIYRYRVFGQNKYQKLIAKEVERQAPLQERLGKWRGVIGDEFTVLTGEDDVMAIENKATRDSFLAAKEKGETVHGFYDTDTKKAYLYLPDIRNTRELDRKVLHEVISHKGLAGVMGEEGFNAFLDRVWNDMMDADSRKEFLEYVNGSSINVDDRRRAADEYVAHVAEHNTSIIKQLDETAWDKFVNAVKEILNDMIGDDFFDTGVWTVFDKELAQAFNQYRTENAEAISRADAERVRANDERRQDAIAAAQGEETKATATRKAENNPQVPISQTQEKYEDFGEKIGWAKKDLAAKGFSRKNGEGDSRPAWMKKYNTSNIQMLSEDEQRLVRVFGMNKNFQEVIHDVFKGTDYTQPFVGFYTKKTRTRFGERTSKHYITDENRQPIIFTSMEQYEATVPVFEARDQGYRVRQDGDKFKIVRPASNNKLVEYAEFATREEAVAYLASPEGCTDMLNRKRENYELPALEELTRNNMPDYRNGRNITPDEFQKTFGFRGGEFGNWNNAAERQQALNYAYDALMDLANVLGLTPEALTLGGELSIAFGARGEGGASAHYEPTKAVINLTKMKGAGSLAHEWAHALDNHFGLMDAKITRNREKDVPENAAFLSEGANWKKGSREEVRDAFAAVMKAIKEKTVTRQIAQDKAQKEYDDEVGYARKQLERHYREEFARGLTKYKYNRKTKEREEVKIVPTEEQLAEYDRLCALLIDDPTFKFEWDYKKNAFRASGDIATQLYELVKDVMPNRGGERFGPLHNAFYYLDKAIPLRERLEKAKAGEMETVNIPTTLMDDSKWFDRMRASDYFAKDIELFARSFENYVSGEMRGNGQSSDYLTYEKGPLYEKIWGHNPYPAGTERADIKMAFDNLFRTIQEKTDEQTGKRVLFSRAYHGTGADFELFDHSHMSEGEGNQAYGWGTYVAFNREVGLAYARSIGGSDDQYERAIRSIENQQARDRMSLEKAKNDAEKRYYEDAIALADKRKEQMKRHLYTVEIPDDDGYNYLHWDEPITMKQSRRIMDLIRENVEDKDAWGDMFEYELRSALGYGTYGSHVLVGMDYFLGNLRNYQTDEDPGAERNSKLLRSIGIVGMVHPAHGVNGEELEDEPNVVIYDENDLKITDHLRFSKESAGDILDRYENQDGSEEYPWMSESEMIDRIESELPYGINTEEIFSLIDKYRRLDAEDFDEGRRDFSGSERDEVFNDIVDALREYSKGDVRFSKANESQRIFISNAAAAAEAVPMDKATPEQWQKMLSDRGGMKAGEDKWLGLSDWLKNQDRKTITKQEVLDFINQNQIQIEEDSYGELDLSDLQEEFNTIPFETNEAKWEDADNRLTEFYREMREKYGDDYLDKLNLSEQTVEENLMAERDSYEGEQDNIQSAYDAMVDKYGDDFSLAFTVDDRGLLEVVDKDAAASILGVNPINETRLFYTTPGLTNKHEIALTVPTIEPWNVGDRIHFGDAGEGRAVAWIRFGDTMTEKGGDRILFIDEIQSKRHQEGREKGYWEGMEDPSEGSDLWNLMKKYDVSIPANLSEKIKNEQKSAQSEIGTLLDEFNEKYGNYKNWTHLQKRMSNGVEKWLLSPNPDVTGKEKADEYNILFDMIGETDADLRQLDDIERRERLRNSTVPAAPFEKNWHELAMKRMLRFASEEGYDYVAWTTGEQQAERYNIGQYLQSVDKTDEGKFTLFLSGGNTTDIEVDENGIITDTDAFSEEWEGKKLSDVVGKEIAVRMMSMEVDSDDLDKIDATIGAEGMKGFYDGILVNFMNKYGKKWGIQVEDINLPGLEESARTAHAVRVTPEMKESVLQGQLMFSKEGGEKRARTPLETAYDVDRGGIKAVVGEENVSDFYNGLYRAMPEQLRAGIVSRAEDAGWNFHEALKGRLAELALADNDDSGLLRLAERMLSDYYGHPLDEATARYILWRTAQPNDSLTDIQKTALKRRWKVGEGDIRFSKENRIFTEKQYYGYENDGAGAARNKDGGRRDGSGPGGQNARKMEIGNDRGRIRVLESGMAPSRTEYSGSSEGHLARREDQRREAQRIIAAAKENGLFIEPGTYSGLERVAKQSRESTVYLDYDNRRVIKVKDPFATEDMTHNSPFDELYQFIIHNIYFPESRYEFLGVTTNHLGDEMRFVLAQELITSMEHVYDADAQKFIKNHGFIPYDGYRYFNGSVVVMDFYGSNILRDAEGGLHLIDPLISFIRDPREIIDEFVNGGDSSSPAGTGGSYIRFSKGDLGRRLEETSQVVGVIADGAKESLDQQKKALKGELRTVARAMSAQKVYDRSTVDTITGLAKQVLKDQEIETMSRREIARLMGLIRTSVGKAPRTVKHNADILLDIIIDNLLRTEENRLAAIVRTGASRTNASGVEVQGKLDVRGQNVLKAYRAGLDMTVGKPDDDETEGTVYARLAVLQERLDSEDDAVRAEAEAEYDGLTMALEYHENIKASRNEERSRRDDMAEAAEEARHGGMSRAAYNEYVEDTQSALRKNRVDRIESFRELRIKLAELIEGSKTNAAAFRQRERDRINAIHHLANSDMQGRTADQDKRPGRLGNFLNSSLVRFFTSPLATFDQMLRAFGSKSVNGQGYLWNKYMREWIEARENEIKGIMEAKQALDRKASEVFGKEMRWSDIYDIVRDMPKAKVKWWSGGAMQDHELTQGQLLYIYMVNKMADGRMKLRRMGISEEDVRAIRNQMDERFITLADWLQDEFLVGLRNKYNAVHERLFGASMAAIEDYFPLVINKRSLNKQEDIAAEDNGDTLPATTTGSIIKRRRNSRALDLLNADAFDVVIRHIEQMERWAAFAEYNRDLNTLLSYNRFRNQVKNMETIYGTGDVLWKNFRNVSRIAGNTYHPTVKSESLDSAAVNLAKGVTAAKINFRIYTAIKQFLSMPAFLADANIGKLAGSIAHQQQSWKWAMENLPLFESRWKSRIAGDTRLMNTDSDWKLFRSRAYDKLSRMGMSPNAFVDALTVAIGAKALYDTKYERYIEDGYTEEQAAKKAKQDATILYNETQQSNEGAFVSTVQLDRTLLSTMISVFRNSSMGFQRQLHDALRNLARRTRSGYREESLEFMTKQGVRDGLTEEQAAAAAEREYNRGMWHDMARVATFGMVVQFAWNLGASLAYLLFGDDDDKKEEMVREAFIHSLFGSIEGLSGGNIMSEALNMVAKGESLRNYDPSLLPLISDMKRIYSMAGYDKVAAFNSLANLAAQAGFGANPETITDAVVAVVDASKGDLGVANEAMLLILRVLQVPQSQLDEIYIDELGMNARSARRLNYRQMADRYAKYKIAREAGAFVGLYSDEKRKAREESRKKTFQKKVNDRKKLNK